MRKGETMKVVQFSTYLDRMGDACLAMQEAIAALAGEGGRLVIEPGSYDFYPDTACERFYFVSNNDKSSKRIGMPFIGGKRIEIEGNGAKLLFHGKMTPAVFDGCEDVCIRDLTVDFDRPFYSEGLVEEASAHEVILKIDATRFPYYVCHGRLHFTGWKWDVSRILNLMQYSPLTGDLEPETADCYLDKHGYAAEELPDGRVRLRLREREFPYAIRPGNVLVMIHATRENPGLFFSECRNIRIDNVTVHHSEGMAFIFQLCRNVILTGCRVEPSERRLISACADATHFVNCSGDILMKDCVMESQCDDATNVHGIYTRVQRIEGDRLYLQFMHDQQEGVPLYHTGDRLCLIKCGDMTPFGECRVVSAERVNGQLCCVTVDRLPEGIAEQDGVENIDRAPENVTITGCVTGKNRARSFLISCRGHVRITGNELHSNGAAIWISGDCRYWYESGPVEDVEVSGNQIECKNSGIAGWGTAAVEIVPELEQSPAYYHGRIVIDGNVFRKSRGPLVHARFVRELEVKNNRLICADEQAAEILTRCCTLHNRNNTIETEI